MNIFKFTAATALTLAALTAAVRSAHAEEANPPNPLREPAAAEKLPWEKEPAKKTLPQLKPISGPREFLTRYGIVASQWDSFLNGQPLSGSA